MSVPILHGPALLPEKPSKINRKAPAIWVYGAALNPQMATEVDQLAASQGVTVSDVIRTALKQLLDLNRELKGNPLPHTDPSSAPAIAQPRLADAYKGSGGSDQHALRQARDRQSQVLAREARGERLVDKTPTR